MTKILSICDNHDAGACIIEDNKIKFAINEERLNRQKIFTGFPEKSILESTSNGIGDLNDKMTTVLASKNTPHFIFRLFRGLHKSIKSRTNTSYFNYLFNLHIMYSTLCDKSILLREAEAYLSKILIRNQLMHLGVNYNLNIINHHLAHAASAYYTSGLRKALVITMDSIGDGVSLTVNIGKGSEIETIFKQSGINAICVYYSQVTELLGFKPLLEEGKVTGLAAYGNPTLLENQMKKLLVFKKNRFNRYNPLIARSRNKGIFQTLDKHRREDVAAALQLNLEKQVCRVIEYWVETTGISDLALSGGLFSNVKLNQRINGLNDVKSVYVFPHMGDGGLAVGAGLAYLKPKPFALDNIYFGSEFTHEQIKEELQQQKNHIKSEFIEGIEHQISELLAKGKTVARFNSRMEYGPRALGNRSILHQANDKSINHWLNKKLRRTEFMPFAPTTLDDYKHKCYHNIKKADYSAKFMNISFDCTDFMKENSYGAVHIDGTARPQLLSKKDNPSYFLILDEYRKITGNPSIINTSFNMHEEPIVCTPHDAVHSFKRSNIDYLAMGDFLITIKNIND